MVLSVICLIALIAAGFHHFNMFYSEYTLSTWQYSLAAYAPWVVLGVSFVFIISAVMYMFADSETKAMVPDVVKAPIEQIQGAVENAAAIMPSAASATNAVTGYINRALNTNAQGQGQGQQGQGRNRNSPVLPGGFKASEY
jgi:hypothetical protein